MNFEELLEPLAVGEYFDVKEAVASGGCTLSLDEHIELTFEHKENCVYLFSPVMTVKQDLSEDFCAFLLQAHLFGLATKNCSFGYDPESRRILLSCILELDTSTPEQAREQVEALVEQVEHWQNALPAVVSSLQSTDTKPLHPEPRFRKQPS